MERDTRLMRRDKPWVFANMRSGEGLDVIVDFVETRGGLHPGKSTTGGAEFAKSR